MECVTCNAPRSGQRARIAFAEGAAESTHPLWTGGFSASECVNRKKDGGVEKAVPLPQLTTMMPRRFCDHESSLLPSATGRSSP